MIKKRYGERNIYLSDSAEKASAVTTTAVAVQTPVVESDVVKSISADGKILTPGDGVGGQIKRLHSLAYNNTLNTFRSFAGRTVIDKRQGTYISYRVLRAVAEKAFLINIIITHTNRIIAPFCKVSTRNNERGFKIRLKDSSKVPTDEEKARMRELEDFFFNTGFDKNKDRGNLISFIKKGNRDLLTIDQICTEKQRTKDGRLYAFWTVDPATISKVTVCEEDELLPERDRVKYVQEVDMHDVAFFTDKDLEFDVMNPRSDIEHSMYGYSYVEQAMDLISGMIKSFTYNMGNFDSDNLPRGMLLLNGDPDPGTVEAFEEYIVSVMSSPADKWRIPLIPSGSDGSSIQWLSLQSKNKDMEFGEWTSRLWASVAALFGVDLEELGIRLNGQTSVIPENPEARIVNSRSRILGDLLSFWDTHLQNILDEIDDKYDFEFVGYEVDDIRKKDESRKARLETIMSINELRAEEDLKPIDDPLCDTPLNPQLVILKGQQGGKMGESFVVDDEETGEEGGDDDDPSPDKPRGGSSPENTQEDEPGGEDNLEKSMSADNFEKSERGSHKYIYKYFKDGQWRYVYEVPDPPLEGESRSQRRIRLAKDLKPITGVNPLDVDGSNFTEVGKREYERLMQLFDRNKITCPALGNRRVVMISNLINHLYYKGKVERDIEEIINRIRVMPFIPSIIQGEKDYTKLIDVQKRSDKNYYEILGKGSIGNKEFAISVILTDTKKDDILYISIFSNEIKDNRKPRSPRPLRKSASRAKAVVTPCIEAVELPVLFQPAFGTATCDSSNYGQVLLKGKAEKEGERPAHKMLEDVQDGLCRHFTMTLNVIYKTLCRYLGLPEVSETMLKARDNEEEPLILNGRVIFSPETGEPLKNRDWQRLINAIEKYIGRKMSDQDQRLVMQNAAVAKIISHLLKNNTREAIEKLRLESVDKKVGFYRATESWKRLKEAFPDLSAADIDRLEFARDNVGNYISSVGADVVKKIKEVYYQAVTGKKDKGAISQELFDWFGDLNRNYERIVKTESNNITNRELIREGLRGAADGEPVYFKRYEGSANICPFCRDANGVIARWSDKPMEDERCDDGIASVWIWDGKTNYGRNRAQWWYSAESFHPNCQGIWERFYP